MFGLKKLLKEGEEAPVIYKDESFAKSNHWELSTSQLSSPYFDGWGYGEGAFFLFYGMTSISHVCVLVVPDGYGLSYSIGDDYIRWTITSLKTMDTPALHHYLAEAATETRLMMEKAQAQETKL